MSAPLVIALAIALVVGVIWLLVKLGDEPMDLLDLNQERRRSAGMAAEAEDMQQMLELANRERRLAGKPEVTEDDLRYGHVE